MAKYLGQLHERNGEMEYTHNILFETDQDPTTMLEERASTFYPGEVDKQQEGYYFFCGGICISPDGAMSLTKVEWDVLKSCGI